MKIVWRVEPATTGKFRSFTKRGWPNGYLKDGRPIVSITCVEGYKPEAAKTGEHPELVVRVAEYAAGKGFTWRQLKMRAKTLPEAKALASRFLDTFPHFLPKE